MNVSDWLRRNGYEKYVKAFPVHLPLRHGWTGASLSKLCLQKVWLPVKVIVCPNDNDDDGNGADSASILTELNHLSLTLVSLKIIQTFTILHFV